MSPATVRKLLISLGIGVGGGVGLFLADVHPERTLLAGLLLTVISEMALLIIAHDRAQRVNLTLLNVAESLPGGGRFSSFISQAMISNLRDETMRTLDQGLEIADPERVPLFWTSCMVNLDSSLRVASYVAPDLWWFRAYGEANVAVQKRKSEEGKSLSRVFIWEREEELEGLREVARSQAEGGLRVRHIARSEIDGDAAISRWRRKLGTPDVALIDGKWAVLHHLGRERETRSLVITRKDERVKQVQAYLDLLEQAAREFPSVDDGE